jgi:hypothetical protein
MAVRTPVSFAYMSSAREEPAALQVARAGGEHSTRGEARGLFDLSVLQQSLHEVGLGGACHSHSFRRDG